jgi:hypothetical protein
VISGLPKQFIDAGESAFLVAPNSAILLSTMVLAVLFVALAIYASTSNLTATTMKHRDGTASNR